MRDGNLVFPLKIGGVDPNKTTELIIHDPYGDNLKVTLVLEDDKEVFNFKGLDYEKIRKLKEKINEKVRNYDLKIFKKKNPQKKKKMIQRDL